MLCCSLTCVKFGKGILHLIMGHLSEVVPEWKAVIINVVMKTRILIAMECLLDLLKCFIVR